MVTVHRLRQRFRELFVRSESRHAARLITLTTWPKCSSHLTGRSSQWPLNSGSSNFHDLPFAVRKVRRGSVAGPYLSWQCPFAEVERRRQRFALCQPRLAVPQARQSCLEKRQRPALLIEGLRGGLIPRFDFGNAARQPHHRKKWQCSRRPVSDVSSVDAPRP